MKIWEGTDAVLYYNVEGQDKLKQLRLVHLPEIPEITKVQQFAQLYLTLLPKSYSLDSVVVVNRTRYI